MIEIYRRYKAVINYGFFGICTTLINIAVYYLLHEVIGLSNLGSTSVALVIAIAFAFISNKFWVFSSKNTDRRIVLYEVSSFLICRALTGLVDITIMLITVDYMNLNPTWCKVGSNVIVIILNYLASKIIVFRQSLIGGEE